MMVSISDILAEYDLKRNREKMRMKAEKERAFLACPALKALYAKRNELLFSKLESVCKGKEIDIAKDLAAIETQIQDTAKKNGIDLAAFEEHYSCPKCGDTGYVEQNGKRELCTCLRKEIYEKIYCGKSVDKIKENFENFRIDVYPEPDRQRAANAKKYVKNYIHIYPNNEKPNILLMGRAGLGKTMLLNCAAKELAKKEELILYIGATDLFSIFYKHRLSEINDISNIFDARLLIIDDLGAEPLTQNVTREYLFQLLETRKRKNRHTLIATNLTERQLLERYGERCASRLLSYQDFSVLRIEGTDNRLKKL